MNESVKQQLVQNSSEAVQTASQTSTNSGLPVNAILADPIILIIVGALGIAFVGLLVIAAVVVYQKSNESNDYVEHEDKSLEEICKPEFMHVITEDGQKNGSKMRRDLRDKGVIYKDVRFTEKSDLQEHMQKLSEDVDDFNPSIDNIQPDEEQLQRFIDAGVYTEEQVEEIRENGIVPHRLMWIRKSGILESIMFYMSDALFKTTYFSRLKLLPEHKIVDNPGDNSVSVDRDMQLRPFAGVDLPLHIESFGIVHSVVMRNLYEQTLEGQANQIDKILLFDSKFGQQIEKLKAEARIEESKNSWNKRGVAGDVNNA